MICYFYNVLLADGKPPPSLTLSSVYAQKSEIYLLTLVTAAIQIKMILSVEQMF